MKYKMYFIKFASSFLLLYQISTPQSRVDAQKLVCPDAQQGSAVGHRPAVVNISSTSSSTFSPQVVR
jgi:hypothetical protein